MPLIRVDYSPKLIDEAGAQDLVKFMLEQSIETFHSDTDAVSVFTKPFETVDHSTAAAEIEIRAKVAEFDQPGKTRDEVRIEYMAPYEAGLKQYCSSHGLTAPIIFTITFEDWKVSVVSV